MTKTYNTVELIAILEQERQACLAGRRYHLTATPYTGNPVIDRFLKPEAMQKFSAYQNFKAAIHTYQREHQVSGIIWREITLQGETLRHPIIDDQLIALPSDLKILKAAKSDVLKFWQNVTQGMDLYLSVNQGRDHYLIHPESVDSIAERTEWATLLKWEKSDFLELLLQLGWGQPEDAAYRRGWPISGSEYIHGVKPGKHPIC